MAANPNALLEHATQAEKHLEQLATGLAQSGAEEGTVQVVTKMADAARKLVSAIGRGTGPEQPAPAAAPAQAPQQGATMQSAAEGMAADVRQ